MEVIASVRQVAIFSGNVYEVTLTDATVLWVPQAPLNADYVRVQAWVAAGGTIAS